MNGGHFVVVYRVWLALEGGVDYSCPARVRGGVSEVQV